MRKMYQKDGDFVLSIEPGPTEFFLELLSPLHTYTKNGLVITKNLIEQVCGSVDKFHLIVPNPSDLLSFKNILSTVVQYNQIETIVFDIDLDDNTYQDSLKYVYSMDCFSLHTLISLSANQSDLSKLCSIASDSSLTKAAFVRISDSNMATLDCLHHNLMSLIEAGISIVEFDRDHQSNFTPKTYRRFLDVVYTLYKNNYESAYNEFFPSWKSALWPLFFYENKLLSYSPDTPEIQNECSLIKRTLAINSEGKCLPCGRYSKSNSTDYHSLQATIDLNKHLNDKCLRCELLSICGGGCHAIRYLTDHETLSTDPHCWK